MRHLLGWVAIAIALSLSSPALADGFYVGGEVGYGWSQDSGIDHKTEFEGAEIHGLQLAPFSYDWGSNLGQSVMGGASVGYSFDLVGGQYGGLRLELGSNYRPGFDYSKSATYDSYDEKEYCRGHCAKYLSANAAKNIMADFSSIAVMGNAYYDMRQWGFKDESFALYPTVGGGIGFSRNSVSDIRGKFSGQLSKGLYGTGEKEWSKELYNVSGAQSFSMDDQSDWDFAWQAMAGIGLDFGPGLTANLLYRYVDLGSVSTGTKLRTDGDFGSGEYEIDKISADLQVHEIVLGIRKTF